METFHRRATFIWNVCFENNSSGEFKRYWTKQQRVKSWVVLQNKNIHLSRPDGKNITHYNLNTVFKTLKEKIKLDKLLDRCINGIKINRWFTDGVACHQWIQLQYFSAIKSSGTETARNRSTQQLPSGPCASPSLRHKTIKMTRF